MHQTYPGSEVTEIIHLYGFGVNRDLTKRLDAGSQFLRSANLA